MQLMSFSLREVCMNFDYIEIKIPKKKEQFCTTRTQNDNGTLIAPLWVQFKTIHSSKLVIEDTYSLKIHKIHCTKL